MKNKGFSLVELIIVIAIMAILVGIMAPQLIKYIEKGKVSSDLDLLSSLESAMVYGITEAEIYEDPASRADIDTMIAGTMRLQDMDPTSLLYAEVCDTLGLPDLNYNTYMDKVRSTHGSGADIYMTYNRDIKNPIKIWIDYTDISGERNTSITVSTTNPVADPNFLKVVHIN